MKWRIPAKTFLVGEYVAMAGGPAIVLTTTPCFEVSLHEGFACMGIHPDSPAGVFWRKAGHKAGLLWTDPYQGQGGLGASSAQFVGAYLADAYLRGQIPNRTDMHEQYMGVAWSGEGLKPSGYDVAAQASYGCVFAHQQQASFAAYTWSFPELAFILLHTGQKLATHDHLKQVNLPDDMAFLANLVLLAQAAFQNRDETQCIHAVNAYQQALQQMGLMAAHTLAHVSQLGQDEDILAVKGCGAMGADVLLLLVPRARLEHVATRLQNKGYSLLATSAQSYTGAALLP